MTKILFNPRTEDDSINTTSVDSNRYIGSTKQISSVLVRKTTKNKNVNMAKSAKRSKNTRNRKSYDQMIALIRYFKQDPSWSRSTVQKVKKEIGMKTAQVYKWGYDQKLKLKEIEEQCKNGTKTGYTNSNENDTFMSDDSIQDYNEAVIGICRSVSGNKAIEGTNRKNSNKISDLNQAPVFNTSFINPIINNIDEPMVAKAEETHERLISTSSEGCELEEFEDSFLNNEFYFPTINPIKSNT